MNQSNVNTKPYKSNAPIPNCQQCITLPICKAHISTATNFDESMIAIDQLTNKCSIIFDYTMDMVFIRETIDTAYPLPKSVMRSYFSMNEDRAIQVFEIIIPRKGP